jgi:hypothetical protein
MQFIRRLARKTLPEALAQRLIRWRSTRFMQAMAGQPSEEIFAEIYRRGMWGGSASSNRFYSGRGSHIPEIVEPYFNAVTTFLESFDVAPDVVDLGCGDFAVGSRLRPKCGRYVACDIVPELIAHNSKTFAGLDVDFRVLNMATGALPDGDIAFIRLVMQHMSNAEIAALLPKLRAKYRYLVITEQVPGGDFTPNADKAPGVDIRIAVGSGIVLTAPPFALAPIEKRVLCEVREGITVVLTHLYRLS